MTKSKTMPGRTPSLIRQGIALAAVMLMIAQVIPAGAGGLIMDQQRLEVIQGIDQLEIGSPPLHMPWRNAPDILIGAETEPALISPPASSLSTSSVPKGVALPSSRGNIDCNLLNVNVSLQATQLTICNRAAIALTVAVKVRPNEDENSYELKPGELVTIEVGTASGPVGIIRTGMETTDGNEAQKLIEVTASLQAGKRYTLEDQNERWVIAELAPN